MMRNSSDPMDEADRLQLKNLADLYPVNLILMELSLILNADAIATLESNSVGRDERIVAYNKREQATKLQHLVAARI
jgi:hypothetical protein